jgi:hypothetical protein
MLLVHSRPEVDGLHVWNVCMLGIFVASSLHRISDSKYCMYSVQRAREYRQPACAIESTDAHGRSVKACMEGKTTKHMT